MSGGGYFLLKAPKPADWETQWLSLRKRYETKERVGRLNLLLSYIDVKNAEDLNSNYTTIRSNLEKQAGIDKLRQGSAIDDFFEPYDPPFPQTSSNIRPEDVPTWDDCQEQPDEGILPHKWFNPDCCTLLEGNLLCLNEELSHIKGDKISVNKEVTLPKVKVHTLEKENRLYSQTNILFPPEEDSQTEKGYYFYLEENLPPDEQEKLMAVLNLLADEGLGGDRSSGCGLFKEVRITEAPALTETSDYYLSLSLINPTKDEQPAFLYYPIVTRGGRRINSHQRLKMVNMVGEGAILSKKIAGRIVDISPNNDGSYQRYGKAFLYPLHPNIEQLWNKE